jgi:hypothetical protein
MTYYDTKDVEELRSGAVKLKDSQLQELVDGLSTELDRRRMVEKGLDVGETLQFDALAGMVKARTRLGNDDVLAMIRAHAPKPARNRLPHE